MEVHESLAVVEGAPTDPNNNTINSSPAPSTPHPSLLPPTDTALVNEEMATAAGEAGQPTESPGGVDQNSQNAIEESMDFVPGSQPPLVVQGGGDSVNVVSGGGSVVVVGGEIVVDDKAIFSSLALCNDVCSNDDVQMHDDSALPLSSHPVMESPTAANNINNNNDPSGGHIDAQSPPSSAIISSGGGANNNNPNGNGIGLVAQQCFTNSCYVATEPTTTQPFVVPQPQQQQDSGGMASQIDALNLNAIDLANGNVVTMTPKEKELVQEILVRERRIRELEDALRIKNEEVAELRSHLDKFQSVFPFNNQRATPIKGNTALAKFSGIVLPGGGGTAAAISESEAPSSVSVVVNSGPVVMHHRQRAQGISAEPQSSRSMFELLNVTFPKFDKEER